MRGMMGFVLGAGARNEIVKGTHLGGHIGHLGVYDADCFFVDGFRCGLNGGIVVINHLKGGCQ